jgi:hypothetical protein
MAMEIVKLEHNRDIMAQVMDVFKKHWENGNHWMLHLITKSDEMIGHLIKSNPCEIRSKLKQQS